MLQWDGLFPLVLILSLQVCSKVLSIVNIVLILSLQSPWSSVTQGPFVLRVSNTEDAAKAEVVEYRFARVWSMLRSDWMTDCLSNFVQDRNSAYNVVKGLWERPDDGHDSQLVIEVV